MNENRDDDVNLDRDIFVSWSRDPKRQFVSHDPDTGTYTYSRPCTVSKEYVLIRTDESARLTYYGNMLEAEANRFYTENITPREFDAMNGADIAPVDRSR